MNMKNLTSAIILLPFGVQFQCQRKGFEFLFKKIFKNNSVAPNLLIISHFRFPAPPVNLPRWKLAQEQAASGEQVLLKKILKSFPFFMDFLDGDIQFRLLHNVADVFVDGFGKNDLSPLVGMSTFFLLPFVVYNWRNDGLNINEGPFETWFPNSPRKKFDWEGQEVAIPKPYNFRHFKRAAIVKLGYGAFVKGANEYFQGVMKGEVCIGVTIQIYTIIELMMIAFTIRKVHNDDK